MSGMSEVDFGLFVMGFLIIAVLGVIGSNVVSAGELFMRALSYLGIIGAGYCLYFILKGRLNERGEPA